MHKRTGQYWEYIEVSTSYKYSQLHLQSIWGCVLNTTTITENLDAQVNDHTY